MAHVGEPTLYSVLGVQPDASAVAIRCAFKRQALVFHPDKGGSKEGFQQVLLAFETLFDPARRTRYDQKLSSIRIAGQTFVRKEQHSHGRQNKRKAKSTFTARAKKAARQRQQSGDPPHSSPYQHFSRTSSSRTSGPFQTCPNKSDHAGAKSALGASDFCRGIREHIRCLSACSRKVVFAKHFTQEQRLVFEDWLLAETRAATAWKGAGVQGPGVFEHAAASSSAAEIAQGEACSISDSSSEGDDDLVSEGSACEDMLTLRDCLQQNNIGDDTDGGSGHTCLRSGRSSGASQCNLHIAGDVANAGDHTDAIIDELHGDRAFCSDSGNAFHRPKVLRRERGAGSLSMCKTRGKVRYCPTCTQDGMSFWSKDLSDLTVALDYLVIVIAIKQRVASCGGLGELDDIGAVVSSVLAEHDTTAEHMGLRFQTTIHFKWWWFPISKFFLPVTQDATLALQAWRQCQCFKAPPLSCHISFLERRRRLREFQAEWADFRAAVLDIAKRHGQCPQRWCSRLDRLEVIGEPLRESAAMCTEERWQRQALQAAVRRLERWSLTAMAAEERHQRRVARQERRFERQQQRGMKREDRRVECDFVSREQKSILCVGRLVCRWWRRRKQEQHKERRERLRTARLEAARAKERRRARWR